MSVAIRFPGTSGNYLSKADTNLLDADMAHMVQSNQWTGTRMSSSLSIDADGFGQIDSIVTDDSTGPSLRLPTLTLAASGQTTFSLEVTLVSSSDGGTRKARVRAANDGTGDYGSPAVFTVGQTQRLSVTVTPSSQITYIWMTLDTDFTNDDAWRIRYACIRSGTSTTFVPSHRIVGDDYSAMKVAFDDPTPTSDLVLWDDGATKCTLDTSGDFTFEMWGDATAAMSPLSTLVAGTVYTVAISGVESTGVVTFTIDGVTQDTDTLTPGSPTYADLSVGASTAPGNEFDGDVYWYERRDGDSSGPIVARMDADDWVGA